MFKKIEKPNQKKNGLARDERGLSTVEYIILLVLIAVAAIAAWGEFGDKVKGAVNDSKKEIPSVSSES